MINKTRGPWATSLNWETSSNQWIHLNEVMIIYIIKLTKVFRGRFFKFAYVFSQFRNYFPLEKGGALHLITLESPSPKDALCKVWFKLAWWFWRRWFFKFVNVFSLFRNYLPWKRIGPSFEQTWIPFTQGCLLPSFVEKWLSGAREDF